jgi:outer membrane protein OmpA-like peptidoglycan-associated protein
VPERTQRGLSFEASETGNGTGNGTAAADLPTVSLNVPFAFDSADLTGDARRMLREVGKAMTSAELAPYRFLLEGHTDSVGPASYNKTLSQRRARAVREFLTAEMGVPENKLATRGHGERFLRDPQNPESAANRRVEIINIGS